MNATHVSRDIVLEPADNSRLANLCGQFDEHLRQIDSLRARRKYDEALLLCEQFAEMYENSDLLPEAAKKRQRVERAREFSEDCHRLRIKIHGTFVVGLPGETKETIQQTIQFAKDVNPHTLQVSLPAAYPGTFLYDQAKKEGWHRNVGKFAKEMCADTIPAATRRAAAQPAFHSPPEPSHAFLCWLLSFPEQMVPLLRTPSSSEHLRL